MSHTSATRHPFYVLNTQPASASLKRLRAIAINLRAMAIDLRTSAAKLLLPVALATALCAHIAPANAADLPAPTGQVLLTVSGQISNQNNNKNNDKQVQLDLEMLEAMESTTIETKTPWTEGVTSFTGVALSQVLELAGAQSGVLTMIAEDGYIYELRTEIDDRYPVIIAYKKNNEYMSLRELGPLWVMFPFDDFPELNTEELKAACVWQLRQLVVK